MKYSVLGLGYAPQEYDEERTEWMKHGIEFDFAESLEDAAEKLRRQNYVCIAIRSDRLTYEELAVLYPELGNFAEQYNKMAFRNLNREMLDYLNTLWENVKIN